MGSRLKEDEKNERIIRGLLKQPHNRKCINCNILGPQYVCITFSTFVCTTCSGIHREFTHRVKSISMAKFTPQEIASLQAGGNERAREVYFKEWDPQRHSAPDSSNVDRLRDFIKHVYVDRRYTAERSTERPPRTKLPEKEETNENRRSDAYSTGSRSPPYDESYERRYSGRSSPGYDARRSPGNDQESQRQSDYGRNRYDVRRSPGYDHENQRQSEYGRSPVRSGILNDWRREDRFGNGRKSEDRRSSDGESKPEIKSPDHQKDSNISSLPSVRPVKDILGENVTPLRISEPPKANSGRVADGTPFTQRTASSNSLASSNGNPTELKRETSLIDFDAEPEPPVTAATPQAPPNQSVAPSTSATSDDNWACFDSFSENKSQAPPSSNPLESVLSELSVPAPSQAFGSAGNVSAAGFAGNPAQLTGSSSFPSGGAVGVPSSFPTTGGTHQQQPLPPVSANQSNTHLVPSFPSGSSIQALPGTFVQASQAVNPAAQTTDIKTTGRTELPADLFTASYAPGPYQAPGWHAGMVPGMAGMVPGMAFPMQYNPAMSMPTFPQPSKSANPFDVHTEASPVQAAGFPSMSSLHATLPNMAAARGLAQTPYVGGATPSFPSVMPQLASSFGSATPGAYMGQQFPNNMMLSRPQGFGNVGSGGDFGSLNPAAAAPNPSVSGNPFG